MLHKKKPKPLAKSPTNLKHSENRLGFFERYLTIWVIASILIGIGVGKIFPSTIDLLGQLEWSHVNIPVAVLIWLMIIPMLIRIDLRELKHIHHYWRGISITMFINWFIKPFSMALLGWLFIKYWFSPWLPAEQINQYIAGLIILGAAPCTAMVFVWSYLCKGEPHFTLSQVALNDLIIIVAFAPIVSLLLGITKIHIPWNTLLFSVFLYIVIPFLLAQTIRMITLRCLGAFSLKKFLKAFYPVSLIALLLMLILLFSFQGEAILKHPIIVLLLALPILVQVYFNSMLAYWMNKITKEKFCIAGPSALIGASNFFELAVATAVGIFGLNSGAALATVVGVLVEVPVMLSVVKIVNKTKRWYEAPGTP